MKIRCIAVDDENLALDLLAHLLRNIPDIELIGSYTDPQEALPAIQQLRPDLIFMDIMMPGFTGLQLIPKIGYKPAVVLITAYNEFAFEAFDLDAVDYMLKPYDAKRLERAIEKALAYLNFKSSRLSTSALYIKHKGIMERIETKDILFIEGLKQYVKIVTSKNSYVQLITLKDLLDQLPSEQFKRIHKSFIVAVNQIESKQYGYVRIGKQRIPIGRQYKDQLG